MTIPTTNGTSTSTATTATIPTNAVPASQQQDEGMKADDWTAISQLEGNNHCVDCYAKFPTWASIQFGVLCCTRCCGGHRALGSHVTRVRSVTMDPWTSDQIQCMKAGGNQRCLDWLQHHGITVIRVPVKDKYTNDVASLYRTEVLPARIEGGGRLEPKSLQEAERLRQRKKPSWWSQWNPTDGTQKPNKNDIMIHKTRTKPLVQRIQRVFKSSDFFMTAYVATLVGLPVLALVWIYR